MPVDNLFSRVKNAIRGQKSSFCSRATSVTPLGTIDPTDSIQYTDCNDTIIEIPYSEISDFNGYIDDCVKGGSPITPSVPVKLFVQYGTTDCNTPPPGSNLIVIDCNKGNSVVVDPSGFTLQKDAVHYLLFNDNIISDGCYTIGNTTNQLAVDSIRNVSILQPDCLTCQS